MKKYVNKMILSMFAFVIGAFISTNVFAMTPTWPNDAKFDRGVSNAYYYVDGTATSYTSRINAAVDNWVDTGWGWNPIYLYPVASNYATHIDFYVSNYQQDAVLDNYTLAYAGFWDINSNRLSPAGYGPSVDYFYTEVKMNEIFDIQTSTIIHEMGHCFGLAHSTDHYSIMYPTLEGTYVTTVQKADHDTINYLYN